MMPTTRLQPIAQPILVQGTPRPATSGRLCIEGERTFALYQGHRHWAPTPEGDASSGRWMPNLLNLACSKDIRRGWVNVDFVRHDPRVVKVNLFEPPWPFPDEHFDYILASHFFEHVPHTLPGQDADGLFIVLEEIARVLKPGGQLEVVVPHPANPWYWEDPSHQRVLLTSTWSLLAEERPYHPKLNLRLVRTEEIRSPGPLLGNAKVAGRNVFLWAAERPLLRRAFRPMYMRWLLTRGPRRGAGA